MAIYNMQYRTMRFQNLRRKNYFEGWYYKQVSQDESTVLSLIPGTTVSGGKESSFVQAILAEKTNGEWQQTTDWLDISDFKAQEEPFSIRLGDNRFRRDGISVSFQGNKIQAAGELRFGDFLSLPVSLWAPTVMGPFSYLPTMECIHSVVSLSHGIRGVLTINGRNVDFSHGKGYIEKDWGSSFPSRYIWLQSNHFTGDASLFFSWADIPMLGLTFQGYLAHLYTRGKHYRFATYTRGSCRIQPGEREAEIILTNRNHELRIMAEQAAGAELIAPQNGRMVHTIKEGLHGKLSFCLKERGGKLIQCDQSETSGVELVMVKGNRLG